MKSPSLLPIVVSSNILPPLKYGSIASSFHVNKSPTSITSAFLSNKIALYKVKNIIDKENLKNIIKLNRPPRGGVVNRGKSNE